MFGSTLVAVFDFLSPRVVLLPIASSIVVVGLLAALALRKFIAPSLPMGSAFRRALAPEAGLHKSPMLIAIALLSALMVSGTAWSVAASASGGIIASKFDVARNAQTQLGVLQGVQKEQRAQTAVLEDIREGRTLNPRRELANQGVLWTRDAFRAAIKSADLPVLSLFLSGGMKWGLYDGLVALRDRQDSVASQLIGRADLLDVADSEASSNGCSTVINEFMRVSHETKKLPEPEKRAYVLRALDKQWLKLFCGNPEGKAEAQSQLRTKSQKYEAEIVSYKKQLSETPTANQCRRQLEADGGRELFQAGMQFSFSFNRAPTDREMMLSVVSNQLATGGGTEISPNIMAAVNNYCTITARKPAMNYGNWSVQSMQQIVNTLN